MSNKVDIKNLFLGLQDEMQKNLEISKSHIVHQGEKGNASETKWIKWLTEYLPKRYDVGKAFVIDCMGSVSKQLDLVIYDRQYTPFVFNHESIKYIPAESVYAVFDVKQTLNRENIIDTSEKISSVRVLHRTTSAIHHAGGCVDKPKPPFSILGGIVTTTSDWNPPLGESFENVLDELDTNHFINIGCSIDKGSFIVENKSGKIEIVKSDPTETLIAFFLNLFMALQSRGTVPAMDVREYAKVLKSIEMTL